MIALLLDINHFTISLWGIPIIIEENDLLLYLNEFKYEKIYR